MHLSFSVSPGVGDLWPLVLKGEGNSVIRVQMALDMKENTLRKSPSVLQFNFVSE